MAEEKTAAVLFNFDPEKPPKVVVFAPGWTGQFQSYKDAAIELGRRHAEEAGHGPAGSVILLTATERDEIIDSIPWDEVGPLGRVRRRLVEQRSAATG